MPPPVESTPPAIWMSTFLVLSGQRDEASESAVGAVDACGGCTRHNLRYDLIGPAATTTAACGSHIHNSGIALGCCNIPQWSRTAVQMGSVNFPIAHKVRVVD